MKTLFQPGIVQMIIPILALVALNFFFGVFIGIKTNTFSLQKLPDFLKNDVLLLVGPLLLLAILAPYHVFIKDMLIGAVAIITAHLINELRLKIKTLFFGQLPPST
jgi:hypothetical protein